MAIRANEQPIEIPSICIPRVFTSIEERFIEDVFYDLFGKNTNGECCVTRVDFLLKQDRNTGEDFHVVFVHFDKPIVPESREHREELEVFVNKLQSGQDVKIEYRFPWFWKVRINKGKKRTQERRRPRMVLTDEDEEELKNYQKNYRMNKKKQETAAEEGEETE